MYKVGIVGGTGYTGVELMRLLAPRTDVEVVAMTSRSEAGTRVDALYPSLRGLTDLAFTHPEQTDLTGCDLVFFATPNGIAMQEAPALLNAGVRVIDLAADFRLKDQAVYEQWYKMSHAAPDWLAKAVYGLPEQYAEQIRGAQLVANPGCHVTTTTLAILPLIEADFIDPAHIVADTKSGASGAGRGAAVHTLLAEAGESVTCYAANGHRHLPEIRQTLESVSGRTVGLTFLPHLVPMVRGIESSVYIPLTAEPSMDLQAHFEVFYQDKHFVDVLPAGSHPQTRSVRGSNRCQMAVFRPQNGNMLVISSVIDNLVKGAAGQAVQNMNLMLGLSEHAGLDVVALSP